MRYNINQIYHLNQPKAPDDLIKDLFLQVSLPELSLLGEKKKTKQNKFRMHCKRNHDPKHMTMLQFISNDLNQFNTHQ